MDLECGLPSPASRFRSDSTKAGGLCWSATRLAGVTLVTSRLFNTNNRIMSSLEHKQRREQSAASTRHKPKAETRVPKTALPLLSVRRILWQRDLPFTSLWAGASSFTWTLARTHLVGLRSRLHRPQCPNRSVSRRKQRSMQPRSTSHISACPLFFLVHQPPNLTACFPETRLTNSLSGIRTRRFNTANTKARHWTRS
jgi:hypothetical protein